MFSASKYHSGVQMVSLPWIELEKEEPALARFGSERLDGKVSYLATLRSDGKPLAHPVTPVIGGGHIFVFLSNDSPRSRDLLGNPDFCLHCSMSDSSGSSGEFQVSGVALKVDSPDLRSQAESFSSFRPSMRSWLFELFVSNVMSTTYRGGQPRRFRWTATEQEIEEHK